MRWGIVAHAGVQGAGTLQGVTHGVMQGFTDGVTQGLTAVATDTTCSSLTLACVELPRGALRRATPSEIANPIATGSVRLMAL
jgi:hypothetical protein